MPLTDNTLATANDLGVISSPINISDVIGGTDPITYYKFTIAQNSDIAGTVDWATGSGKPAFLRLLADFNGNGITENNERIDTLSAGGDGSFSKSLPVGTYYLEVDTDNFLTRNYSIQLGATPKPGNVSPEPGSTFGQALDLGGLSAQRVLKDYIGTVIDPVDIYKFTLSQKTNIGGLISGTTDSLRGFFASDTNGNGVYDSNETVDRFSGGANATFSVTLAPGTYFLQVSPRLAATSDYATQYELTLNPVPDFSGNDTLTGTAGVDTLNGFAGDDRLIGLAGNDRLIGGTENDTLLGDAGKDTLLGEAGNDVLEGGAGKDRLEGGTGNDTIITGGGRDIVVIGRSEGVDTIRDFRDRSDRIDLTGRLSFGQLTIRQRGKNTLIRADGSNLVVLQNFDADLLSRSDFI
jgi:Ca2+-binding RTX toxin-like protein